MRDAPPGNQTPHGASAFADHARVIAIVSAFVAIICATGPARAQFIDQVEGKSSSVELEQQLLNAPASGDTTSRLLSPSELDQILLGNPKLPPGNGDRSIIRQNGDNNSIDTLIEGGGNSTYQLQRGNGNDSTIRLQNSNNNLVAVLQYGDNHSSTIDLRDSSQQAISHVQIGSGQSFSISRIGEAAPAAITVIQVGRR